MKKMRNTLPGSSPSSSPVDRYQKLIWIFLIAAALLTAGLVVYILFWRTDSGTSSYQGEVKIEIQAPPESASGSELSYEITARNETNTTLTNLILEIFYPRGFSFIDSTPDPQEATARKYIFSNLPPNDFHKLVIVGRLSGDVQEIKTVNLKLHFIPENFRSAFTTEANASTIILAPDLLLQIQAPSHIVTGQTINYQFQIMNIADQDFSELLLKVIFPEKFEFTQSAGEPPSRITGQNAEWDIMRLSVRQSMVISVAGKIFELSGKESFLQAELLLRSSGDGGYLSASRTFAFTKVRATPLVVEHRLVNPPAEILVGQELKYEVGYENRSDIGINNLVITLVFETPIFNFAKIPKTGGQLRNSRLEWVPAAVPELLVVDPGQKGRFEFTVPVSDKLVSYFKKNPLGKTRVEYTSRELPEPIAGNTIEFKVQTQIAVSSKVTLLSGNHPPRASETTTYRVEFTVSNTVNDVGDALFLAILPRVDTEVDLNSVEPAEERELVEFVPVAGQLRWKLGKIFAFTGSFHERRILSFEIKTTPARDEVADQVLLFTNLGVEGVDEFTGKTVSSNKIERLVR